MSILAYTYSPTNEDYNPPLSLSMSLIKSISGIRGTIGGPVGDSLSPLDIVRFTSAYAAFISRQAEDTNHSIVVGRDARISGHMVKDLVCGTLRGMGYDVVYIGLATTPTTELAVEWTHSAGGIIITASHNPRNWNALKLLNHRGEFLSAADGQEVLRIAAAEDFTYAEVDSLGSYSEDFSFDERHIQAVLSLPLVNVRAIQASQFRVVADGINSVGGVVLPKLFDALSVDYTMINPSPTGQFAHNPEPLEENLSGIMDRVKNGDYHMGIVVDPDVDRLAFICEDGTMYGEEYTLVSVADYVLSHTPGNTVSNLSSTRALADVTARHKGTYSAAAVGEVNVTTKMKEVHAVIGGEGNGGVIYPESHYGRDALVGIALFLSYVAEKGESLTSIRASLPTYYMAKTKVSLQPSTNVSALLKSIQETYAQEKIDTTDGVKIDFDDSWAHLRLSNTEPIMRIYTEARTVEQAEELAREIITQINTLL